MNTDGPSTGHLTSGMNQTKVRELLPEMTEVELDTVIEMLPMESVTVITPPTTGLIMTKVRDCFGTDFFLGEILVTRTEVGYGNERVQVTLMGNLPKHALVAGSLEVLEKNKETATINRALEACRCAVKRIEKTRRTDARLTAATRVQFESMAEEA